MAEKQSFKIPKSLAVCADRLYTVRQERLALEKLAEAKSAEESALREHLINNLPKSQASGISGKIANAAVKTKQVGRVTDWDKVWGFIVSKYKKRPGITALMQKRVNDATLKEMVEAGEAVPGMELIDIPYVSLTKV